MTQPVEFLADGGRVGALMRSHDWSASPLGPPEAWPQSLRTVVGLLLQSGFPMFVAWGKDLGFLYNDPYAEILGAKHPAALGKRFHDIWSEIWSDISPLIDAAMAGQASYREDLPLVMNRKGYDEQTWFTFSYSPVRDETGKVAGMFCAVSETTQKVLAERALRESEGRLHALVAASSYALYRMSLDWSHMLALEGQGFMADTSSPSGAWLGDYLHPDDRSHVTAAIQAAIATRSMFELEHRVRRIDGTLGWTLSRAVPLFDANGNITEWFGAASDVTARKNAEAALRELNETLERRVTEALAERKILADIVEGTDAFVQVVDLGYRLLAINNSAANEFERIFGVRPKAGDNLLDLLAAQPDQQRDVKAMWSRALSGEEFTAIEEVGDPARVRRAYEMRFNTLRGRDRNRIGAYQFVYDVTERLRDQDRLRNAEAALRQTQKMESLGQLTGGVAHDFNNLLAVFASGVQLLERSGGRAGPRVFEAMRRAVARGTDLTRHLLAFSRRRPVNPESIDVVAHLKGMRAMLDGSLGGHIDVQMDLASDVCPVEVDTGEMELAILNLCLNARDAMTDGGFITIAVENAQAERDDVAPEELVKISIADAGHGMPPEVQARVFEPFFTTKDISKGSGLGLPQVYGFAQQSGGRVTIASEVGVGTIVTLLLPRSLRDPDVAPRTADVTSAPATKPDAGRRGQILLVEDDREVATLTHELLSSLGFAISHVASAEAALGALANSRHIDLVLSDIMMPGGVSGLQLAREIRRRYPETPVILTTGYVEAAADMKDGEFALLLKPFTVEALADALAVDLTQAVRQLPTRKCAMPPRRDSRLVRPDERIVDPRPK
jgi:signal transduction histidine kinase/ActR/RegA family two-component response regulator